MKTVTKSQAPSTTAVPVYTRPLIETAPANILLNFNAKVDAGAISNAISYAHDRGYYVAPESVPQTATRRLAAITDRVAAADARLRFAVELEEERRALAKSKALHAWATTTSAETEKAEAIAEAEKNAAARAEAIAKRVAELEAIERIEARRRFTAQAAAEIEGAK